MVKEKFILTNGIVVTLNEKFDFISNGAVVVSGDTIIDIGKSNNILKKYTDFEIIDVNNNVIMPGLVNTHTHISMSLFRGLAEDLPLEEWLDKTYGFREKFVTEEILQIGIKISILEMLKSGITTIGDMSFHQHKFVDAINDFGIRAVLFDTIMNGYFHYEGKKEVIDFIENNYNKNPLIKPGFGIHAPYSAEKDIFVWGKEKIIDKFDIPYTIHIAETKKETHLIQKKYGYSSVELLNRLGYLSDRFLAVHCIHLNDNDINLIQKNKVNVAYNPESNMKLGNGIADIVGMLEKNINVSLGTDGAASNNDLDMFREMDTAAKLQKVATLNPTVLDSKTVLKMATIKGAKSLGLDKQIGSIEIGKKADIITINFNNILLRPVYDIYAQLVYMVCGRDVDMVFVNGKLLVKNGKTINFDENKFYDIVSEVNYKINSLIKNKKANF